MADFLLTLSHQIFCMKFLVVVTIAFCSLFTIHATAQTDAGKPVKIAVFSPVYLDSAFTNNNYKLGNSNIPKNILPGLEFYTGVMMAIDSLQSENAHIEVLYFDSKSSDQPMNKVLAQPVWDSVSLIIASFNNRTDVKPLADFAAKKNIPLISSTFPNDGGTSNNPFFILINSTLRTHCEGLYRYIQKNYSTGNLVYIKRKGAVEDMIQSIFTEMGKNTPSIPLKYKTIELTDSFSSKQLLSSLDSNKQNIVICGTINEPFGARLVKTLNASRRYQAVAIGMPTWDGIKDLNQAASLDSKGIEIIYSSPYNFSRNEKLSKYLTKKYKDIYFARASDWVFKGYESMYHFTKLLLQYKDDFVNHLSSKDFTVFNEFDVQPVKLKKENIVPDYLENKKLYFIKKQDGIVKSVN